MIWIIGEYAERIDNADELLESFLDGFHDENTQVQLQLLTAIVKLFLKRPTDTQALVQQVLSLATQDSDNPDLRDRGFIYWRLLSTDPGAAKEVVLAEKPLIAEETDLIEPTLLDELICHIASLASVYHKPPTAFVEGRAGLRRALPKAQGSEEAESNVPQATVIPSQDSLIPDLLNMDISTPAPGGIPQQPAAAPGGFGGNELDLLGGGLDSLLGAGDPVASGSPAPAAGTATSSAGLLGDIFGVGGGSSEGYVAEKTVWLPAARGKGLEILGTFSRRAGVMYMDLTLQNKAMQPMSNFAVQLNKNSFGLVPASMAINVATLAPGMSSEVSVQLNTNGPIQRMDPLTNLQVAIKNSIDIFYFAVVMGIHIFFCEDGAMDKRVFLSTWKDIPSQNEVQFNIENVNMNADGISNKLQSCNVFTIAKRNVEGQDMLYQSVKLTNGIWVLTELKVQPGNTTIVLSLKSRATDVAQSVFDSFNAILHAP